MIEVATLAMFLGIGSQIPSTWFGPSEHKAETCEKVAVTSDRTGEVLYYNCK